MALMYRLYLTLINIIFPPLTVLFLTGFGFDCLISCIFFLLAVIPSHIHGNLPFFLLLKLPHPL